MNEMNKIQEHTQNIQTDQWEKVDKKMRFVFEIKAAVFERKKNAYFLYIFNVKIHKNGG